MKSPHKSSAKLNDRLKLEKVERFIKEFEKIKECYEEYIMLYLEWKILFPIIFKEEL